MKISIKSKVSGFLLSACLLSIVATAVPTYSFAETPPSTYTVLAPLPCIPSATVECDVAGKLQDKVTFQQYVQYSINLLIALAAVAAVFMIVYGGFEYMTTGSVQGKSDGIDKVKNAIYGLILVLASYLIISTIDPRFVNIPTTLVPKLKLVCPGQPGVLMYNDDGTPNKDCKSNNSSVTMLQQLQDDANKYHVQAQSDVNDAKQTQAQAAVLQSQLDSVNSQLSSIFEGSTNATQDQINQLSAQKQNLSNQINALTAKAAVQTQQAITKQSISDASTAMYTNVTGDTSSSIDKIISAVSMQDPSSATDKQIAAADAQIDATTKQRVAQLQSLGASDQIQTVMDQGQYAKAVIQMKAAVAYFSQYPNDGKLAQSLSTTIDAIAKNYSATIKTDASQQALTQAASDTKNTIQSILKTKTGQ